MALNPTEAALIRELVLTGIRLLREACTSTVNASDKALLRHELEMTMVEFAKLRKEEDNASA